jgi:hypothetical protein
MAGMWNVLEDTEIVLRSMLRPSQLDMVAHAHSQLFERLKQEDHLS